MKNTFCRICRGRFNLKYPPAAFSSQQKNSIQPHSLAARIAEGGEISENICWDCEETLLGFHKSISEDTGEEEPVVVDDDEILYKSLEKTRKIHRLSKQNEVIQIDSDSDPEALVLIPAEDDIISVESASEESKTKYESASQKNNSSKKKTMKMKIEVEDCIPKGKVFESKQCPMCSYHSGIEHEVVLHIRQIHPHYKGDNLRVEWKEGDSELTRRIVFAHLWTFYECKECGKLYDKFWPHRKHIITHERKKLKNGLTSSPPKQISKVKNLKRPLDEIKDLNDLDSNVRVKMLKTTHNEVVKNKTLIIKLHKSEPQVKKHQINCEQSKSIARKQQQLQARRERRRLKKEAEMKAALKQQKPKANSPLQKEKQLQAQREKWRKQKAKTSLKKKAKPEVFSNEISKPTFKMPNLPAPRASSLIKPPTVQKLSFNCKLCSKVFDSFLGWNSHMLRYHSRDEFIQPILSEIKFCKFCDKEFNDIKLLQSHVRHSHRRKNKSISLEINGNDSDQKCCQNQVHQRDDRQLTESEMPLQSHEFNPPKISSVSALFCHYCGSLCDTLETFNSHESNHILNEEVKRFSVTKICKSLD